MSWFLAAGSPSARSGVIFQRFFGAMLPCLLKIDAPLFYPQI
jgi:hypothetical protein